MTQAHALRIPTPRRLLQRLLDEPALVREVQALSPLALRDVVEDIGLEDAGELIALTTTDQLRSLLDEDLWISSRPGSEEVFSPSRFALWLEILLEAGEAWAADRLAELSEDLVALGILHHALVLDLDALALEVSGAQEADDLLEKALDSHLYVEIDEYRLLARFEEHWDSVLQAVLALDERHPALLRRVLERCARVSRDRIEDSGGLYEVLSAELAFEVAVAGDRQERRAALGYVAPEDARSFLAMAAAAPPTSLRDMRRDAVTAAYFRDLKGASRAEGSRHRRDAKGAASEAWRPAWSTSLPSAASARGEAEGSQRLTSDHGSDAPVDLLRQGFSTLRDREAPALARRQEELIYVTNVILAGLGIDGRRYRPVEALEIAIRVANLGLLLTCKSEGVEAGSVDEALRVGSLLESVSVDQLFRVGWHALHEP